jgi:hypothetical protein
LKSLTFAACVDAYWAGIVHTLGRHCFLLLLFVTSYTDTSLSSKEEDECSCSRYFAIDRIKQEKALLQDLAKLERACGRAWASTSTCMAWYEF